MTTHESDVREYNNFMSGTMKPATTRAIVVSNVDPLFAGRVKVWIPSIHGPTPYDPDGVSSIDPDIEEFYTSFGGKITDSSSFKNANTIVGLPWASVLSHNLGPISDIDTGINKSAGIFSLPAPGTEVIIMFENNDPRLPVVVGSIIHANEFRHSMSSPLEYLPGIVLAEPTQRETLTNKAEVSQSQNSAGESYTTLAAQVYNLRTASGSTLFISDSTLSRAIVLEGTIGYGENSTLTDADKATLSRVYPAFPTTASAAFAKRTVISSSGASPLMASTNFIGSDAISGTGITTVTPSTSVNIPTTEQGIANNGVISQALQDCANATSVKRTLPMSGAFEPSGGADGRLHAPRAYRNGIHHGIDIRANGSNPLIAPIDCFPLAYKKRAIGWMLLVLGIDGFAHAFEHLHTVDVGIMKLIDSGVATKVPIGKVMGTCGITLKINGNTGPHLHWEVWNASNVRTTNGIVTSRTNAWSAQSTIDGLKDWVRKPKTSFAAYDNNTAGLSVIDVTQEQAAAIYINSATEYSSEEAPNFAKPGGLEISLVPGKETVTIRHPSGSFIGFDPDGNINIYSCGDINFRANRSITYDVLGVILENAYAKYSRIRTILRSWARSTVALNDYKEVATSFMPEFFSRVDNCRSYDMVNALASTINNSFIIDSEGNQVSPSSLANAAAGTYQVLPSKGTFNFDETKWNDLISQYYNKWIKNQDVLDLASVKAIMYVESNANSSFTAAGNTRVGLYGITDAMLNIAGKPGSKLSDYFGTSGETEKVKANIDVAMQYLVKISSLITTHLNNGVGGATLTNPDNISNKDLKFLIILAYRFGIDRTIQMIDKTSIDTNNPKLTYGQVENVCIIQRVDSFILSYVPTVDKASNSVK
ncbi:MAG: peptidoglycan DD-metalloendopeptidase family protein [Ignisphaera sp.]|nr:peptidoglycan DD-metalloendopeptidase family protein [Ignisphaera sp.]